MLGESLVEKGLITDEQLRQAELRAKADGEPLRKVLVKKDLIGEEDLAEFLSQELDLPFVDLTNYLIESDVIDLVPESLARKHLVVPILKIGDDLTVAMVDPSDIFAVDELHMKTDLNIELALATESEINKALDKHYSARGTMEEVIGNLDREKMGIQHKQEPESNKLQMISEAPPVVKLVNMMIIEAVHQGASDIHVEPEENSLKIRFRIDGLLHERPGPPKYLQSAVISRIKIMAEMDISERRVPQDGRIQLKLEGRDVDVRVSSIPTIYGENVVLRLLDKSQVIVELGQLGFSSSILTHYKKLINSPHGIILVCGPTGSGKTTTLYACLNAINSDDKNIHTVEDPIEYHLAGIRQMHIDPKVGLLFDNALSALLRQDPDVIMVGEIRNTETAKAAVQAALTGHLVFSTLHTNDAPSAVTRLIDMGIEPFLISSSVIGVLSQRLVRAICRECKGKGCKVCLQTGFKGRIGIFELMVPDQKIRELINAKASSDQIRSAAIEVGMQRLYEDGRRKVDEGVTTIEEILRVTEEI